MSMEVGRIDLGLDVNKKEFNRQLYGIAGGAEKDAKKAFSGLGAKIGFGLGLAAVASFTESCLDLGSSLTEVQNVVDTVFPKMNGQVNNFAKNAMDQFGLSETVAKKYTGTLGAMSKSMGFSEQAALSMAEGVTGLSGDVASFYNLSSDEAYTKLKSIWTGETESLKELGVIMTQTNLDQYALNNGFGKTTKGMDEQTKTMLRYQYVTSSLAAAQGDFAKTSDSWANQVRVLGLRFDSLKATLGQGFINLFTPILQGLNNLIGKLQGAANAFKSFTELVTGKKIETSTGAVSSNALNATSNILGMGDAAETSAKKAAKSLAGFDELNLLSKQDSGSSNTSASAGTTEASPSGSATISDVDSGLLKAFDGFKEKIQPTIEALGYLKEALKPIGEFVFSNVKSLYNDFLVPVGTWMLGEGLPGLVGAFTNLISNIDWPKLSVAIEDFNKAIAPLAISVGTGFVNFVKDLSEALKPALATTTDLLADAIGKIADVLSGIDPESLEPIGTGLGVIATTLGGIKIVSGLASFLSGVGSGLGSLATGLVGLASLNPMAFSIMFSDLFFELDAAFYNALPEGIQSIVDTFWATLTEMLISTFNLDYTSGIVKEMIKYFNMAFEDSNQSWVDIGNYIVTGILLGIYAAFSGITEPIIDFFALFVKCLCKVFGIASPAKEMKPYGENIMRGILQGFIDTMGEWASQIATWGKGAMTTVGTWATSIWTSFKGGFTAVGTWFTTTFNGAFTNIKTAFNGAKTWAQDKCYDITEVFKSIPSWFKTKFSEAWTSIKNAFSNVGTFFSGIWDTIKTKFTSIGTMVGDAIGGAFKTAINAVLATVENVVNAPIKAINALLKTINKVPGININQLSTFDLPRLANGGYVGANQPQLAMIGDNKREGEIVAPESKLRQLALEAVRMAGGSGGLTEEALYRVMSRVFREFMHFYIGDEDLARHVNNGNDMLDLRFNPVKGGA